MLPSRLELPARATGTRTDTCRVLWPNAVLAAGGSHYCFKKGANSTDKTIRAQPDGLERRSLAEACSLRDSTAAQV